MNVCHSSQLPSPSPNAAPNRIADALRAVSLREFIQYLPVAALALRSSSLPLGYPALDRADDLALALPLSLFIPTALQALLADIPSTLDDPHPGIHYSFTPRRSRAAS
jgi:hypothetical protein